MSDTIAETRPAHTEIISVENSALEKERSVINTNAK